MFKVNVLGRLVAGAEAKVFGERAVLNFTVISSRRVKKGDEWVEEPTSLPVSHWVHKNSKLVDFLQKGQQVYISGVLGTDVWEKEGVKNYKIHLVAEELELAGKAGGNSEAPASKPASAAKPASKPAPQVDVDDDEIPF